jgi:hypothetical protein
MANNPLVGSRILSKKFLHDMLVWMVDNERNYCCTSIEIHNSTGADVVYDIGTIVADADLSDNATPANLQPAFDDAILLERKTVPAGESRDFPALVRGPALVNFDELVRTSDSETDSHLAGRCDALIAQGIRFVREPATKSTVDLNG